MPRRKRQTRKEPQRFKKKRRKRLLRSSKKQLQLLFRLPINRRRRTQPQPKQKPKLKLQLSPTHHLMERELGRVSQRLLPLHCGRNHAQHGQKVSVREAFRASSSMKDFQPLKPGVPIVEGQDMCSKNANVPEAERIQTMPNIGQSIMNEERKHCSSRRNRTKTIPVEKAKTNRKKGLVKVRLPRRWLMLS